MYTKLFPLFILFSPMLSAQIFTEVPSTSFHPVSSSAIAFADVDGDDDQDLLITGLDSLNNSVSKLYLNDGQGNYIEKINASFVGVFTGAVAFIDVDQDLDQDLIISGFEGPFAPVTKLYNNPGDANFFEVSSAGVRFEGLQNSAIGIADIDNDQDMDVLLSGRDISNNSRSLMYTNAQPFLFNPASETPFAQLSRGSIAFADVDGDDDQDVLLSGRNDELLLITQLYLNDGNANFSAARDNPFPAVDRSAIAFADVDADQDQDLLITGLNNNANPVANLYLNDGEGNFSRLSPSPFEAVFSSSIAFVDVDNDLDEDLLITGLSTDREATTKLYLNDGEGNFSELVNTPFEGVSNGSIAFADVDGDQDQDLLITGRNESSGSIAKLFLNNLVTSSSHRLREEPSFSFLLSPNPISSDTRELTFGYEAFKGSEIYIEIYDLNGKRTKHEKRQVLTGQGQLSLDLLGLQNGTYLLKASMGTKSISRRFIIQNP